MVVLRVQKKLQLICFWMLWVSSGALGRGGGGTGVAGVEDGGGSRDLVAVWVFMGTSATMWREKETRAIVGISGVCREEITEVTGEKRAMVVTLKWLGNFF